MTPLQLNQQLRVAHRSLPQDVHHQLPGSSRLEHPVSGDQLPRLHCAVRSIVQELHSADPVVRYARIFVLSLISILIRDVHPKAVNQLLYNPAHTLPLVGHLPVEPGSQSSPRNLLLPSCERLDLVYAKPPFPYISSSREVVSHRRLRTSPRRTCSRSLASLLGSSTRALAGWRSSTACMSHGSFGVVRVPSFPRRRGRDAAAPGGSY